MDITPDRIYGGAIGAHQRLGRSHRVLHITPEYREQVLQNYLLAIIASWNSRAPDWLHLNPLPATGPALRTLLKPYLQSAAVTELCEMTQAGTPEAAPGYFLFDDKIDAVIDLLCAIELDDDLSDRIAFDAETQWGKTIVLIMLFLLRNLWLRSTGAEAELILIFGLPRNAPDDQTSIDRRAATILHGALTFAAATNQFYDLRNACDEHQTLLDRTDENANQLKRVRAILPNNDDDETRLTIAVAIAREHGIKVRLLQDEGDSGTNVNGVYARIVQYARDGVDIGMVFVSATGYQYRWISSFRQIACSIDDANTTYCGTVRGHLTPVFAFGHDRTLLGAEHLNLVLPRLYGSPDQFDDLQRKLDEREKRAQKRNHTLRPHPFDPIHGMSHDEYRDWCGEQFLALLHRLINEPPFDPERNLLGKPLNGGQGIMLRFGTTKDHQIEFIESIEEELLALGIHPIPFFGSHLKRKNNEATTIKASIDRHHTEHGRDARYMVCVVHAARRSDRFPASTTVFIDFTERYTTMQALEQGTMGRLSGFKLSPKRRGIALISDHNSIMIRVFRALYAQYRIKMPVIRPAIGAITVNGVTMKRTTRVITLNFDELRNDAQIGPTIAGIERQINAMFTKHIVVEKKNQKTRNGIEMRTQFRLRDDVEPATTADFRRIPKGWRRAQHWHDMTWYWPLFQRILTEPVLTEVELWLSGHAVGHPEVMRPYREYAERLAKDDHDWVQVAVGNFWRGTSSYRNTTQHVDTTLRRNHGPGVRMKRDVRDADRVPNCLFEQMPDGGVRGKSISLYLAQPIYPYALGDRASILNNAVLKRYAKSGPPSITLADETCMWFADETNDEQELVREASGRKRK